ncbi:alpha/beta hydrolase [Pseudomaricurvus alcaniphilus]|uniref:alpha/beta hydrolase n=1 Tax=Pseudomaricurvus alcaniphilus TaxID=1166482 RepID=UPI00140D5136|nr:alpha/beta hydrolase [Pseudomaricurvus alcaniphilus]NHN37891.1 alpha/beta hydrolase [Pseudomaricurvus alcaniphilus]
MQRLFCNFDGPIFRCRGNDDGGSHKPINWLKNIVAPTLAMGLLAIFSLQSTGAALTAGARITDRAEVGASVRAVGNDSFSGLKVDFAGGVSAYPDVTYASLAGFRTLKLDLFIPPASYSSQGARPLVVYVHGGGWAGGGPRRSAAYADWPKVLGSLAAEGYVVASVAYRFSGEAPFPAAIQDVKSALRWLRVNAAEYRIDPERVAIWGQSAGGHLAALAGTSCGVKHLAPDPAAIAKPMSPDVEVVAGAGGDLNLVSDCVQAVVGWFGVYDFEAQLGADAKDSKDSAIPRRFLDCETITCSKDIMAAASPITYVDPGDPHTLLIHGDADPLVHVSQTDKFYQLLIDAGVPVSKIIIPGVGHSWIGGSPAATAAASRQALQATVDFFEATIGKGKFDQR